MTVSVQPTPKMVCQFAAVVRPLVGPAVPGTEAAQARLRTLRQRWFGFCERYRPWFEKVERERIAAAGGADAEARAAKKMKYLPSCRSPFEDRAVRAGKKGGGSLCGRETYCPYCYARRSGEIWDLIADFLHPIDPETRRRETEGRYDLVLTHRRFLLDDPIAELLRERIRWARIASARIIPPRTAELRRFRFEAGYDVLSIEPVFAKARGAVKVAASVRQLFAVEPGAHLGEYPDPDRFPAAKVIRIAKSRVFQSARAVGAMLQYPRGLLTPPADAAHLDRHDRAVRACIEARASHRLAAAFGGFRKSGVPGRAAE